MKLDGLLYMAVSMLTFGQAFFSSDDAAKWVDPATLFWCKFGFGIFAAGTLALKMYRSTKFADSKNGNGNGNGNDKQKPITP